MTPMQIKVLRLGQVVTNCYLMADEAARQCVVIDPADHGEQIALAIQQEGWTPSEIWLTHSHFDHILGIPGLRQVWPELTVFCHPLDMEDHEPTTSMFGIEVPTVWSFGNLEPYEEGDIMEIGGIQAEVLHTPGHTPGSICLRVDTGSDRVLFTGDTLFAGSMGRTDFPGGSEEDMVKSLARLGRLTGDYRVCPGHEGFSTLFKEQKYNPCLKAALERVPQ